jgi:hypothetical protein
MSKDYVTAIEPSALRMPLPPIPSGFERELANVGSMHGKPMFKIVDGQTEMHFRRGKMDIKHLLQNENFPCYVPVVREAFRRQIEGTDNYKRYGTAAAAVADTAIGLGAPEVARIVSTKAVGRACWIIEVYVTPEEIGEASWNAERYAMLAKSGVPTKIDVLGEFPRDGMYVYCFSVLGEDGEAIAPNDNTLMECKKRWQAINSETPATAADEATLLEDKMEAFEKRQTARIADSFYQYHGISARRPFGAEISKPITQVKTA